MGWGQAAAFGNSRSADQFDGIHLSDGTHVFAGTETGLSVRNYSVNMDAAYDQIGERGITRHDA